ncbi:MAG: hypothetical protein R6T85_05875 [Egibacteraceae bacterium]
MSVRAQVAVLAVLLVALVGAGALAVAFAAERDEARAEARAAEARAERLAEEVETLEDEVADLEAAVAETEAAETPAESEGLALLLDLLARGEVSPEELRGLIEGLFGDLGADAEDP